MTGEYPRATDTFIQREVATLRELGYHIQTISIRKPGSKETVSPEVAAERDRTRYILPASIFAVIGSHLGIVLRSPGRYLAGIKMAMSIRPPGMKAALRQLAYFAEAGVVAKFVRDEKLVHLHNHFANSSCSVAVIASRLGAFTFSFTMHGPAEFYEPKYWCIGQKISAALFVNCISWFCRSQAMVFAPIQTWDRLHIVHCGVDVDGFAHRQHAGQGNRLLYVGRLAAVKGLPILLRAMAALKISHPAVSLDVAGDGPDRSMLEQLAAELGIAERVRFLGYQSQQQVRSLLEKTDVFVMSSFAEGVPVVLMEAAAAGVPSVATRIAGIPELIEDGVVGGLLVPPGDVVATAEAIAKLLNDAELRNRLGSAGREKVSRDYNLSLEARWMGRILTGAFEGRGEAVRPE
jgi:glycosyltransferase involved in cell wall biosynthesis